MSEINRKFVAVIGIQIWTIVYLGAWLAGNQIPMEAFVSGAGSFAWLGGADQIYDLVNALKKNFDLMIPAPAPEADEKKAAPAA